MVREKGEGEDWGWRGGMRWGRKDGNGSRQVYISTKGAILGLARDLFLEVPRFFPGEQRRGCLNWPWPITILMNILHITIEPSSGDGWR